MKIGRAEDVYERWIGMVNQWPYLYPIEALAVISGGAHREGDVLRRFRWCLIYREWHRPTEELLAFADRCLNLEALELALFGPRLPLK